MDPGLPTSCLVEADHLGPETGDRWRHRCDGCYSIFSRSARRLLDVFKTPSPPSTMIGAHRGSSARSFLQRFVMPALATSTVHYLLLQCRGQLRAIINQSHSLRIQLSIGNGGVSEVVDGRKMTFMISRERIADADADDVCEFDQKQAARPHPFSRPRKPFIRTRRRLISRVTRRHCIPSCLRSDKDFVSILVICHAVSTWELARLRGDGQVQLTPGRPSSVRAATVPSQSDSLCEHQTDIAPLTAPTRPSVTAEESHDVAIARTKGGTQDIPWRLGRA
jgi:hypothetical protein